MLSMELRLVYFCVLLTLIRTCLGQAELQHGQPHGSQAKLMPSVCNGSSLSVEIRLPFMDMELRHERSVHVLRTEHLLLVLHGNELFQLQLGSADKRLVRLGDLLGRVSQQASTAAAVVVWHEYLLLAVALPESLEFYQLPQQALLNTIQLHFEPIQEFALAGNLQHLKLLKPNPEQVLLLLISNYTPGHARCRTFEWLETYFNPVEELTLPAIKTFQIVGRQPHYIITGRSLRGQSKLALTIYELLTPSLRLQRRQSLTVQSRHVLAVRFRHRNLLFACGTNTTSCLLFRMVDGIFVVYRKHVLRQLQFSQLAASDLGQLLVGARANGEVLVFNSHRLDCYSGFGADTNPSGVYTHRNPQNETFILLSYMRDPSTTLLRMVQLGGAGIDAKVEGSNDDLSTVQLHRHEFEATIGELRSLLLRRKQQLDAVRQAAQTLQEHDKITLNLEHPLHVGSGSRVEQVHLQGQHLATPTQLQRRMEQLRHKYVTSSTGRFIRSFGVGNESPKIGEQILKVRRLHVKNLIYQGELLPGYNMDSSGPPILTIRGQLLAKQLHTEQLLLPQGYNKQTDRSVAPQQQQQQFVVRHLQVARINNVAWFDFYDSLFLHSRDTELEGRLVLQSRARVVNLQASLLNGLMVHKLFNLRQPQVVSSNIYMSAFFVPKLDAKLINGLNFAEDIVMRGVNNTLIKTPVRINQMSVSGDIIVSNATKWARQMGDGTQAPSILQQYYTGTVTLNGSLTVNNLQADTQKTRLQLNGQSLRAQDLHAEYLLLQKPQNLTSLKFGHARVTAPALNTNHINGHPIDEHLLLGNGNMANPSHKPLHLIFMNATVVGDIKCGNYSSRLAKLARDAVRQGETATITGHKHFEAPITVDTLKTQRLNGIRSSDLVLKSQLSQNFTGLKHFARIVVKDQLEITDNLSAQRLNHLALSKLLQPALSMQRLELLETPHLQHLIFQRLNGLAFDELFNKLSVGNNQQLLLNKQLIIEGNVRFEQELQLQTLNDIPWDTYLKRLVNANENSLLTGRKTFLEPVVITDALQSPSINDLDLSLLLENTLLRTTPQAISGDYSFQRMTATNVDVPWVNDIPADSFLDTQAKSWHLQGDLYLDELRINGSFSCSLPNNPLPKLRSALSSLQQRPWHRLVVLGDALWDGSSSNQHLDYLRQHAVRRRGPTQIISGHVILEQPRLSKIQAPSNFPDQLNITHLSQDALLRQAAETQVIHTPQTMLLPVLAHSVNLQQDSEFGLLNDIDINRLNDSLYRRSSGLPIQAQLHFQTPPKLDKLQIQGQLNGIRIENIFEQSPNAVYPPLALKQLHLNRELQLDEINGMNLEYLLQQRVPLRGAALELFGTLRFEHLQLGRDVLLRSINGIPLHSVVYKNGKRAQAISGMKTFNGGIELHGPSHVMRLNGKELSESYQSSIFTDRDYNIDSLFLDDAIFQGGLVHDVGKARQAMTPYETKENKLQELLQHLKEMHSNHTQRLHYLDYDTDLEASWSDPAPNQTYDLEVKYMPKPSSICQLRQLRARLNLQQERVHLSEILVPNPRLLRLSGKRIALRVKAQNYCHQQQLLRSRSRIHINCRGQAHLLGLAHHVESLELLEQREYSLLLINTMEELRILHVNHTNCSLSDWQSLPSTGAMMQLLQLERNTTTILVHSALYQHLPIVAVHRLDAKSQRFELIQHIEGDYDLAVLHHEQLLLSCHSCRHIAVHVYSAQSEQFVALQQIHLDGSIQQLLPFAVAKERHLLVMTRAGSKYFYLFSYAHIEGWQQRTYGHMAEFEHSWPLIRSGQELTASMPVLLLCGQRLCSLVKALLD